MNFRVAENHHFRKEAFLYFIDTVPLYLFAPMQMLFSREANHSFLQINIKKEPSLCAFPFMAAGGSGLTFFGPVCLYTVCYNRN
jgi:hypothetical protein